jgi:D-alanyl-D-alanine carboxypeptidase/D-alanyl-D-alanine-endopeptidase (penicillin-binding protein 4)
MVGILDRMYDPDPAAPWMLALPLAGVDGTLINRMRSTAAERNVRAKTGSMSNVRSLAGYVTTRGGEHLAFTAIVNNFEGTGAEANQALDNIAVRLATFTRPAPPPSQTGPPRPRCCGR